MGTNNFNNNRSSKVYSVNDNYYDEENIQDEFIYDDTRSNISYELMNYDKNNYNIDYVEDHDLNLSEVLRSYPATSIGTLYTSFSYAGLYIDINIIPKTVAGYYEGFNLDYEIDLQYDGISYDNITDILHDFIEYNPTMKGIFKIHHTRLIKILTNDINFLIDIIEKVFNNNSEALNYLGSFSNGEAVYQKAI